MTYTHHRWFRSGAYSLLGHLDLPESQRGSMGVLIVPPFAWEDVCSYRPLRFLARTLAEKGIPVLRFDLPGMGDSSGDALDAGLLEAWIESISNAAAELRVSTGVKDVAVLGIRLGAMLALGATARGSNLHDLILWGPSATGHAMLREMRAFGRFEPVDYAKGDSGLQGPIPSFEIGGFLISPETESALEAFDLSSLPAMNGRRILFLSRDELPPDAKLIRALESSGCAVELAKGEGYAAMMAELEVAVPPTVTGLAIAEFLTEHLPQGREEGVTARTAEFGPSTRLEEQPLTVTARVDTGVSETVYTFNRSPNSFFGILAEPDPETRPSEWCILFLNPGPVRHIGPNRMWVEAARRWAAQGVASLRLDFLGVGESDGEPSLSTEALYQIQVAEQVESIMASLRARLGVQRFAAVGHCSGAFLAFHSAIRSPDIRAAILLNPRLFFWDPEVERRRLVRRTTKGLGSWRDWRRLVRGDVPFRSIKRAARISFDRIRDENADRHLQISPVAMAEAWASIERNQTRVTLVFAEDEPLLQEMEEEGQMPPKSCSLVRCVRLTNCGHTFRPFWAQRLVHELIDSEIREVLRESRNPPTHYQGSNELPSLPSTTPFPSFQQTPREWNPEGILYSGPYIEVIDGTSANPARIVPPRVPGKT